ncbi:MAG: head-tail connector protein [Planctomycetota bacterium]
MRQPINITVVTPPAELPVSYSLVKEHLRVDDDDERELILQYLAAATNYAEEELQRSLVNRSLKAAFGDEPADGSIALPRGPVSSITTVGGEPAEGVQLQKLGGRDVAYFESDAAPYGAVEIVYVAGYGAAEQVPADIKHGILMHAAHLYEHRQSTSERPTHAVQHGLDAIYGKHRIGGLI